jgi:hypothetical protein
MLETDYLRDFYDVKRYMERISFNMPGVRLSLHQGGRPASKYSWEPEATLRIEMDVPDSRREPVTNKFNMITGVYGHRGLIVTIRRVQVIPLPMPTKYFSSLIIVAMEQIFSHEIREWLKIDDELIDDPHKER